MIKHDGIIIALNEDGTALVRIVQTSACAACKAKAMCASAESAEKEMTVVLLGESAPQKSADFSGTPQAKGDEAIRLAAAQCFDIISAIRNIRAQKNISPKEVLTLVCPEALPAVVVKLANVELAVGAEKSAGNASFIIGTTEYSVPLEKFINVDEELKKLEAELAHQEGFLRGVMGKLNNERFVQNAKPEVVELERKKKADAESRIATIKEAIAQLKG